MQNREMKNGHPQVQVLIPAYVSTNFIIKGTEIAAAGQNLTKSIIVKLLNEMAEQANPFVQMHYTVNQQSIVLGVGEDITTLVTQSAQLGIKHAIHVMGGHAAKNVNLLNSGKRELCASYIDSIQLILDIEVEVR